MSKDIWVIGVAAPCPRCDLLGQRVEKLAKELLPPVNVKKMLNTDAQAIEYAAALGKKIGYILPTKGAKENCPVNAVNDECNGNICPFFPVL